MSYIFNVLKFSIFLQKLIKLHTTLITNFSHKCNIKPSTNISSVFTWPCEKMCIIFTTIVSNSRLRSFIFEKAPIHHERKHFRSHSFTHRLSANKNSVDAQPGIEIIIKKYSWETLKHIREELKRSCERQLKRS